MKKEMTIREMFGATIEACKVAGVECEGFDVIEFLEDRMAKSIKTGTKTEKPENVEIRSTIVEVLGEGRMRLSEITDKVNEVLGAEYTPNKVSAQVTKLKLDGTIVREVEKKVAYFKVA